MRPFKTFPFLHFWPFRFRTGLAFQPLFLFYLQRITTIPPHVASAWAHTQNAWWRAIPPYALFRRPLLRGEVPK